MNFLRKYGTVLMAGGVGVLSGLYIFGPPLEHMAREAEEAHKKALEEQSNTFDKVQNKLEKESSNAKDTISKTADGFKHKIQQSVQDVENAIAEPIRKVQDSVNSEFKNNKD
ncbi:hypothetical protein K7432_007243 [Basidiobolus ranarum]|uniref:Gas vesicle protein n=1 Tax=Basidiobolus ranarum TaxID=34480 RepID=A0ABR2WTP5_9FUNG